MIKLLIILVLFLFPSLSFAAMGANTLYYFNASATASMANGGGFNRSNANFPTDLTTDTNTGNTNSPVVSSATYNFVAGDVGHWVYVASGTNWTPGFYQIASVAANKATLSAAVGQAYQLDSASARWIPNTVAGVATVGTPTGGTFGINYGTSTAAVATNTDLTCTAASTTVTSASAPFTRMMVGNVIHLTALTGTGAIVGWYEIVNYTDTSNVVLDRTPTNGVNNITAGTFYVGGALSLNSTLDDDFFETVLGGNYLYFKSGSYSTGEAISVSAAPSNAWYMIGYSTVPGDNPTPFGASSTAPTISYAGNVFSLGNIGQYEYLIVTGTSSTGFGFVNNGVIRFCKILNTSSTAGRPALVPGVDSLTYGCEAVSQNGTAITLTSNSSRAIGNFVHDSATGMSSNTARTNIVGNVLSAIRTTGISLTSSIFFASNNTVYGYATPRSGTTGISTSTAAGYILGNIVDGFTTGISGSSLVTTGHAYGNLLNNTTNISNYNNNGSNTTGVDPTFTNVTELSGSTATTSGSVLTQSGGDFSTVTDNVDYLHLHSGTGVTAGIYLITAHTSTTVTLNNAPGTNATADKVWSITTGRNLKPTNASSKNVGYPQDFYGSSTDGNFNPGAVQETAGGSSSTCIGVIGG